MPCCYHLAQLVSFKCSARSSEPSQRAHRAQLSTAAQYLQLLGQDGVLSDGVDPQPLVSILERQLPPLHIAQHPPVHEVAPHLSCAR